MKKIIILISMIGSLLAFSSIGYAVTYHTTDAPIHLYVQNETNATITVNITNFLQGFNTAGTIYGNSQFTLSPNEMNGAYISNELPNDFCGPSLYTQVDSYYECGNTSLINCSIIIDGTSIDMNMGGDSDNSQYINFYPTFNASSGDQWNCVENTEYDQIVEAQNYNNFPYELRLDGGGVSGPSWQDIYLHILPYNS